MMPEAQGCAPCGCGSERDQFELQPACARLDAQPLGVVLFVMRPPDHAPAGAGGHHIELGRRRRRDLRLQALQQRLLRLGVVACAQRRRGQGIDWPGGAAGPLAGGGFGRSASACCRASRRCAGVSEGRICTSGPAALASCRIGATSVGTNRAATMSGAGSLAGVDAGRVGAVGVSAAVGASATTPRATDDAACAAALANA